MQFKLSLFVLFASLILFGCTSTETVQNNSVNTTLTVNYIDTTDPNTTKQNNSIILDLGEINGSEDYYEINNGTPVNYLENATEVNSTPLKGGVKIELNTSQGTRTILWQGETDVRNTTELKVADRTQGCPHEINGNPEADLNIKYFWAGTCPWCQRFDPIMSELLQEKGDLFLVEKYDVFKCSNEITHYGVDRTPTFIFSTNQSEGIYVIGFRTKEEFSEMICAFGEC